MAAPLATGLLLLVLLVGPSAAASQCGSAPDPPEYLFTKTSRLHSDDRTWTWNPWDTPPLNGIKDSAQRFTCPDFEFVHPGTLASPAQVKMLQSAAFRSRPPAAARKAIDALLAWATPDLSRPTRATSAVFLVYNPAPHDKARMTQEMLTEFDRLTAEGATAASNGAGGHEFSDVDARRALNHTLVWLATGKGAHAEKAVQIIDAWASTARSFGPRYANGPLEAAWGLALFARAAELLKTADPGAKYWSRGVDRRFRGFVETLLLPNLKYFDSQPLVFMAGNVAGTNWAGTILEARLQYAIFREDLEDFEFCARKAKEWIGSYVLADGQTDETSNRDFMHGQFGIAGMVAVASLLYHQTNGVLDLFEYRSPLQSSMALPPIAAALELHSAVLLDKRPSQLAGTQLKYIGSPPARNDNKDANLEAGLSMYTRKGRALPMTSALLKQQRPEALVLNWGQGTLTHFGPDCVAAAESGGGGFSGAAKAILAEQCGA